MMNRRALLKAAPAALIVGAVPVQGMVPSTIPSPETPIMALFREWQAAQDAENAAYAADLSDEETGRLGEVRAAVEKRLMAEPCRVPQDFICKVVAYTDHGVFCLQDRAEVPALWVEARALIAA